ncbi:NADPH-cytochrome P450 reductase [Lipomyces orientalis]|uniref:NADPH-cytochrome P450 reductase n=1 Tax=Lipomyces orientalis TaxID=1233043 RepID=A0ACC3TDE3_9ASCO
MASMGLFDITVFAAIFLGTIVYWVKGRLRGSGKKTRHPAPTPNADVSNAINDRDIVAVMNKLGQNCVVMYGSQTGTAENYASRLARESKKRFGLETMVADLEDFDFEGINSMPANALVIFVLATYGEGEPTDNAVQFYQFITQETAFSPEPDSLPLGNLNFAAFGLGNSSYEHYNSMVRNVDKALRGFGANRLGEAGEGDDGRHTTEEDFMEWKENMWRAVAAKFGLQERETVYDPTFSITELPIAREDPKVFLGEANKMHLKRNIRSPFTGQNPYVATITESRELFLSKDRNCLHMEIDLGSTPGLSYETGDHVAIWPTNPGEEVDRFLTILGLQEKRHQVIGIMAVDPTSKVPVPTPTTYDAIARYYLEICAPVSRQLISTLAQFTSNGDEEIKTKMNRIGNDRTYFQELTGSHCYNIATFLGIISKGAKWLDIPFSVFLEGIPKLQPRYYSISSSSLAQPQTISITTVVESRLVTNGRFRGVATNYLLALKQKQNNDPNPCSFGQSYELDGPRRLFAGIRVPIHIRRSNFKLPSDPKTPVIMVGPGTGVAPFRGFIQERAKQVQDGVSIGRLLLFFGCRNATEDYVYESEWEEYGRVLNDHFNVITAFSRQTSPKVYVQHRLSEWAKEVNKLLAKDGYFYVCGDAANMAREVNATLVQIIAGERGVSQTEGEEIVQVMKAVGRYQVSNITAIYLCGGSRRRLQLISVLGGCLVVGQKLRPSSCAFCQFAV